MDRQFFWEDPTVYQINKEKGHVLALPYDSEETALARGKNPYRQSLNGQWKFHWRMGLAGEPEGCTLPDYNDSAWGEMKVPAVWQMEEGFSYPYYYASTFTKAISRSKEKIPSIDYDMQEIGIYRRSFLLDSKWSDMEVFLHFGGAKSALELYVNGIFVGYSQGSMVPHEFKVTPYLQPGENQVTVKVYRYSDGTYLENQDMWNLCGIYRDTYLYAEKKACIRDFFFRCDLDAAYQDAQAVLDVCVNNYGEESRPVSVQAYLAQRRLQIGQENLLLDPGENTVTMQALVEKPDLWSAEHPNLYDLVIVLKDGDDILSVKTARVGFKKVEIQGEQILFNGKPMMLYGVNRHDFDPDSGWAVPRERFHQDLHIMKRHNINAIRTSHYPDDPFFYELCNEYGFYVMDECDLETHGVRRKGVPGNNPDWTGAVVDRMERMVLRDRNHPCVFMWSLGNEAGDGDNFMRMKEAALKLDDTRQFHYEGDADLTKSDVISRMYPVESIMKKLGRREEITTSLYDNVANSLAADNKPIKPEMYKGKPVLLCEYAHAMENSLGNFQEYIDDFDQYDNMCGGFIWDFVDQAIRRTGPDGQVQWLYGTDFEKVEPRRKLDIPNTTAMTGSSTYFCANGIIGADRSLQPSIHQVKKGYQYLVAEQKSALHHIYTIRNKYLFTDLSGFTVKWAIHAAGDEVQSGVIEDCHVPPLGEADVVIPYREDSLPETECTLTISFLTREDTSWSEAGYEQAWEQFIIRSQPKMKLARSKHYAPAYRQSGNTVTVEGDGFCITIDDGCISSMVYRGEELLTAPMRPNFYRALTDNDIGYFNFVPPLMKVHPKLAWKLATRTLRPAKVFARQDDQGAVQVAVNWNSEFLRELRSDYIIYPDGRMLVHLCGIPRLLNMVRFGMQMGLDGAYRYAAWYGRGPHETYCDRKTGAKIGKYAMAVADLEHRYMRPQENGNRTDVRMVAFLDEAGHGLRFTAHYDNPMDFSAHYYDTETLDQATHLHNLEYSQDITVNIDQMQCGVGGDMPGAACLREPYIMRAGRPYSYSFLVEKI